MANNPMTETNERKYPAEASVLLAARDDSSRYYFVKNGETGIMSVPAPNAEMARELAADGYPTLDVEDFHEISEEEREKIRQWEYPDYPW